MPPDADLGTPSPPEELMRERIKAEEGCRALHAYVMRGWAGRVAERSIVILIENIARSTDAALCSERSVTVSTPVADGALRRQGSSLEAEGQAHQPVAQLKRALCQK